MKILSIKKIVAVAAVTTSLLHAQTLNEGLNEAFSQAKVDAEIKLVHYSRDATSSPIFAKANGSAIGGNLGLHTKKIHNISFNTRFYTTNAIQGTGNELANTHLVDGTDNYSLLGELNLEYDDGTYMLKVGRQAFHTPLVGSDDARVIKDLFEAVNFSTKVIPETTLRALYITKNSGMDNGSSNFNDSVSKKDFVSMSKTLGTSYDKGMVVLGVKNSSIKDLALQFWYYNALKTVDMFYYGASYDVDLSQDIRLQLEGHYWDIKSKSNYELDTGKKIDYNYGGVRVGLKYNDLLLQVAQEQVNLKDKTVGIQSAWGMYSEYTYGYLLGSAIYGSLNGYKNQYITKADATKVYSEI